MSEPQGVLDFLEESEKAPLPAKMTVNRTTTSKYQFLLVARYYKQRLKVALKYLTYTKAEAGQVKGMLEEHSILNTGTQLFVLEGFSGQFVKDLQIPNGTHIVAETDDGQLKAEPYNYYTQKRGILRALQRQLELGSTLPLSLLLKLDWGLLRSHEEYEPVLRMAKLMSWGPTELEKELGEKAEGDILVLMKKAQHPELLEKWEELGPATAYTFFMNGLADLMHYRALRAMGYDEQKCAREMDLSWRRGKALEDANVLYTQEDLTTLAQWVLETDNLSQKSVENHGPILLGLNPTQLRRR